MTHRRYFDDLQAWCNSAISSAKWCPPAVGRIKCNVNVACRGRMAVLAVCFRDSGGSLYHMYTERFPSINSLFGESSALVAATNIASGLGWLFVDFESDCLTLTQLGLDCSGISLSTMLTVVSPGFLILGIDCRTWLLSGLLLDSVLAFIRSALIPVHFLRP